VPAWLQARGGGGGEGGAPASEAARERSSALAPPAESGLSGPSALGLVALMPPTSSNGGLGTDDGCPGDRSRVACTVCVRTPPPPLPLPPPPPPPAESVTASTCPSPEVSTRWMTLGSAPAEQTRSHRPSPVVSMASESTLPSPVESMPTRLGRPSPVVSINESRELEDRSITLGWWLCWASLR
jgi:hypothetical protein